MIKVAGYCRVSTDHEDQTNSFLSQQRFFREYIACRPEWELYEIYADEGVTGTSTEKRSAFKRMIADAHSHKFSLILTKEVSRFSRNILDTISYTRELKQIGVSVIFMTDGFSTMDPDAELRLSIMGSIAQEESRKTSSRVKWGQTRQMERGVVFGTSMLGYDVVHGKLAINPEGAQIIRSIFHKYGIEKKGTGAIARELQEAGIKTYTGNSHWNNSHILKILKNEKYVGDLIQKKTITTDYLTHTKKYNHGEETMIIHRDHHEPIISRKLWNLVQEEIRKRNRKKTGLAPHSNRYVFSGRIICGECGARFISRTKTRKDGTSYRRWGCYTASREGKRKLDLHGKPRGCDVGKQIRDDLATDMLMHILKTLHMNSDQLIKNITDLAANSIENESLETDSENLLRKKTVRIRLMKANMIDAFLSGNLTESEFQELKSRYDSELELLEKRLKKNSDKKHGELYAEIYQRAKALISGEAHSDIYLKTILDNVIVHKDGLAEMKLRKLNTVWKFQLYKE